MPPLKPHNPSTVSVPNFMPKSATPKRFNSGKPSNNTSKRTSNPTMVLPNLAKPLFPHIFSTVLSLLQQRPSHPRLSKSEPKKLQNSACQFPKSEELVKRRCSKSSRLARKPQRRVGKELSLSLLLSVKTSPEGLSSMRDLLGPWVSVIKRRMLLILNWV